MPRIRIFPMEYERSLTAIDLSKGAIVKTPFLSLNVPRMAATRDGRTLAISTSATRGVTFVDLATNTKRGRVAFKSSPTAVAFTPKDKKKT